VSQIALIRWQSETPPRDMGSAVDIGPALCASHYVIRMRRYADQRALFDGSRSVDQVHEDTEEVVLFDAFAGFLP